MNNRQKERKLIEAFQIFFQKSINPYVNHNEAVMNEWKYFNNIISAENIDYNQIEFYILLANKSQVNQPTTQLRSTLTNEQIQCKYSHQTSPCKQAIEVIEKKSMNSPNSMPSSVKKKKLMGCLEQFHSLLLRNQEKLELLNNKPVTQITPNNYIKRHF